MPYSQKIIELVNDQPQSLGNELGRWAIRRDISMQRLALLVGASRQTVYNWFTGSTAVTPAYQEKVTQIIAILKKTSQTDDAWRILCTAFNLKL
jgi:transcriptional regulator with XRE-family HTH domain